MNLTKSYKTSIATVHLLSEQIIENIIDDNSNIDVTDLLEIKEANLKLANGKKYVVLVNSGHFTTITKEARELTASKEFVQNTLAKAVLINSLPHLLIGRFYIKFNKPHIKTELFKTRDKAIAWLKNELIK
jgi:hypothetical protein